MNRQAVIIILLLFTFIISVKAEDKPQPPEVISVSVDPFYDKVEIKWKPSISDPSLIHGYYINQWVTDALGNKHWKHIDSVAAGVTEWKSNTMVLNKQLWFSVGTKYNYNNELNSTGGFTMVSETEYEECTDRAKIKWNKYRGWAEGVDKYNVYVSETGFKGEFTLLGTTTDTTYYHSGFRPKDKRYYYIIAQRSGDPSVTATTTLTNVVANEPTLPAEVMISKLENKNNAEIKFTLKVSSDAEYNKFRLMKSTDGSKFDTLYKYSEVGVKSYSDIAAPSDNVYYTLMSIDRCNAINVVSDTVKVMLATAQQADNNVKIKWNAPSDKTVSYTVKSTNTGVERDLVTKDNFNSYNDNYGYIAEGMDNRICYIIEASFAGKFGTVDVVSNEPCIGLQPRIWLPTAINPNSVHTANRSFKPELSFNSPYSITIYNRWKKQIYYGENGPWKGVNKSGEQVVQGTYIYLVKIEYDEGKIVEKKGTVTVIYD
jgi:hypothetical protein